MNLKDYIEILLRRKWYIIIPFILFSIGSVLLAKSLPDIYRAYTLILVQPQKIPSRYVTPTVEEDIEERLRTIREQILSRTTLEKVVNEFNLYPELRKTKPIEDVINMMRNRIEVKVQKSQVFSISYEDRDPVVAMKVANRLAFLFIEENLKLREERAEGTIEFLKRELERVKKKLAEQEKNIAEFRSKHLGVLPEQLEANLRTLDRLQLQLQTNTEALRAAEEAKRQLQRLILTRRDTISTSPEEITTEAPTPLALDRLKALLAELTLKYTEKHPDVIRLKNQIAKLEKQLQQSSSETSSEETEIPQEQPTNLPLPREIQNEIVRLNAEIEKLKEERQNLLKTIAEYQRRVEITPKVEKEYQDLIRGYEVLREEYQSLLEKKLDAELAANMEKAQKGEQFRILDPAKVPEKPYKPNRFKIVFLGIALGLGAGVGLAFLMEFYIDTSFYRVEDLETFTELPVLALIPKIKQK